MVSARERLSRSYPATPESVKLAREAVGDFAHARGAPAEQLEVIRLAVSEAVTNAVVHAYDEQPGEIEVVAGVAGGELWVLIADDGRGFQVLSARPGHGWGMPLIAHASTEFSIAERSSGGTEVRMRFRLVS